MTTRRKSVLWAAVIAVAASAPTASAIGVYVGGGLASYSEIKFTAEGEHEEGDMGASWAVGGGLIAPVWSRPGVVEPTFELSTDAGVSMIDKEFEEADLEGLAFKINLIPIRETAIFGVAVGPANMIKPFVGFGGGVGIVMWEARVIDPEIKLDDGTNVKPLFNIPFGCEFQLTPGVALGVKADYLIIPGEIGMKIEEEYYEVDIDATVPDVFLFGGMARFDF